MVEYDILKLENQLCFPLYAAARKVEKQYFKPLSELNLTYTKYLVMMVMWENEKITVKQMGERLFLDSGTLTPVLKSLEKQGLITRARLKEDERVVQVCITKEGKALREKAKNVPPQIAACINLSEKEAITLYKLLYKVLER